MLPLEALLNIGSQLIDRLWPDPQKAAEAKLELYKLQSSGELQTMLAQMEINKVEAANPSLFVAGWRPCIGWVCATALFYQYLLRPLVIGFAPSFGITPPPFPGLDENLWQLMMGMLGLGGLRTFEKIQGVTK